MGRRGETWASDELIVLLARLTGQQAEGVIRIVEAELEGRSVSSLLDREGQICSSNTFYGARKRTGWRQKPQFVEALALARRDYRAWLLEHGVGDALTILSQAAPEAARALRQEVTGEAGAVESLKRLLGAELAAVRAGAATALGKTGLPEVVPAIYDALVEEQDAEARIAMLEALGKVAGWRDGDRRSAAVAILDRADVKTAAKAMQSGEHLIEYVDVTDAELEEIERALRGENQGSGATE